MAQASPLQNPTVNPFLSYAINESIKNNLHSSIFLFLQHFSTSWNDITSLCQRKRTSRGKPAVNFLENSALLLLHSKIWAKFWATFHILSHHFLLILFIEILLLLIIVLQNKQWRKKQIRSIHLFFPHQVYLSLFSLLPLRNLFDCNIFFLILLVGKYFIMTEYNAYMPMWSLTWQKLCI